MQASRKALVLGERSMAQRIGRQLESNGFEVIDPATLTNANPQSLKEIRDLLEVFAKFSNRQQVGNFHGGGIVHPGTTRWAERPELPSLAQEMGLDAICPSARILSLFQNSLNFLIQADRLQVPHLVQSFDPMVTVREVKDWAKRTKQRFPFILKTAKGRGQLSYLLVSDVQSLDLQLPFWLEQLRYSQGEVILFAEKYLEGSRKIVFSFVRFQNGEFQSFPTIDASLQSRGRKIVEFCPALAVASAVLEQIEVWSRRMAEVWKFVGVGAFEFLVDGSRAFLVGGVARLSSGFHLWEQVAETQAVSWQLASLMNGFELTAPSILQSNARGRSGMQGVSLRIYAEDSLFQLPQPGEIHELSEEKVWNSTQNFWGELAFNYREGDRVSPLDTGLLGWIWALSLEPNQLLPFVQKILKEVWIAGTVQTNEQFLEELLDHPWVREGVFHAGLIDEEFVPRSPSLSDKFPFLISLLESRETASQAETGGTDTRWAIGRQTVRWRPEQRLPVRWVSGPKVWSKEDQLGVSGIVTSDEGAGLRVAAFPLLPVQKLTASHRWLLRVGCQFLVVKKFLEQKSTGNRSALSALVPGRVHSILFREGAEVMAHDLILVIESLGVFVPHAFPVAVKMIQWKVRPNEWVQVGQELAEIEVYKISTRR